MKGWAIAALVFAVFRGLIAAANLATILFLPPDPVADTFMIVEGAISAIASFFGLIGNTLLLKKSPNSIWFCQCYVVAALFCIAVGVWLVVLVQVHPPRVVERSGNLSLLSGITVFFVSVALLAAYVVAVCRASKWFAQRAKQPMTEA